MKNYIYASVIAGCMLVIAGCAQMLGGINMDTAEDLNGVKGKIFRVDSEKKCFELLKETVIDPKTNEGQSRHTVYWTDDTVFSKVVQHMNFKNIEGRVLAEFYNLNNKWIEAIEAGEMFKDRYVRILPETDKPHGLSKDHMNVIGWFTPDKTDKTHKTGALEFNGKTVRASLLGPNGAVDVYSEASADDIRECFWDAQIHGRYVEGKFVVATMDITPQPDPREGDDPNLPRVLVIGDSISMNYHEAAKEALKGIANYHRAEGNCGPSDRGVVCAELWLGDYAQKGLHWDLIQFNHGLHDLKQFYDEQTEVYGKCQISLEEYKSNLEKEIAILRKTGAKLMWCSTTPVPNSSFGRFAEGLMGRQKNADVVFNLAAMEVMAKHPDILINDLNAAVRKAAETNDVFEAWKKGTDVHFWRQSQAEVVGQAVADAIKKALTPSRPLTLRRWR